MKMHRAMSVAIIALPLVAGAPLPARQTVRPVVAAPARTAMANGIAGGDLARPAARGMVGGGVTSGGAINGTRLHQRH